MNRKDYDKLPPILVYFEELWFKWGWSDEIGPPPPEWWQAADPECQAPELPLHHGNALVLDARDLLPPEEFPVFFLD